MLPAPSRSQGKYARQLADQNDLDRRLRQGYSMLSGWQRLLLCILVVLIVLVEKEGPLTKLLFAGVPALLLAYLIKRRVRSCRVALDVSVAGTFLRTANGLPGGSLGGDQVDLA